MNESVLGGATKLEGQPVAAAANGPPPGAVRGSAVADQATTAEEQPVTINVLGNDEGGDSGIILLSGITKFPKNGEIAITSDYQVTYTPNENFNGTDTFTYATIDGFGTSSTSTVTVTVTPVNDAPTATDDTASTKEDTAVTVDVLRNDTDIDKDQLTVSNVSDPANGTATVDESGRIVYTPDENFNGTDTLTYTVSDNNGGTATGTLTVEVQSVNDLPVATADTATTDEDTAVQINVLANDTDVESDNLEITRLGRPAHGTVTQNDDGSLTYTPTANYNGPDSFTYTVRDADGGTSTATVNVTVNAVNDAPTAADDTATINEDSVATVAVLRNDTDPERDALTVSGVTGAQNGTATVDENGNVVYTPDENFNGTETLTYTVSDGNGGTAEGTLTIEVKPVNDVPTAAEDTATTDEDTAVQISVLANDTDVEGTDLTLTRLGRPQHGTATISDDGTVLYTPTANYNGPDSFTYTVRDADGGTSTSTVNVTVNAVNDAPEAADDRARLNEDTPATLQVLANDKDIDGDTLTISDVGQPSQGTVSITDNGTTILYTPDANATGSDTFTYTVSDGNGGTDTATVTLDIANVNDVPEAQDGALTTNEDTAGQIDLKTLASDVDGDTLRFSVTDRPEHGTVRIGSDGVAQYTPTADFSGADSFVFTVSDGRGGTAQGTVNVTVDPVNDAPVAADDSVTGIEDSTFNINVLANDRDPENDQLTVSIDPARQPTLGAVQVTNGQLTYTANPNANGTDTFGYIVNDGNGGTDTATVTVRLTPVNDPPDAADDQATTTAGTPVSIPVLANDVDPDGDSLSLGSVTTPANGTARISGGNIIYTPDDGFTGTNSFTYAVTDRKGGTDIATVTVNVQGGTVTVAAAEANTAADPIHNDALL